MEFASLSPVAMFMNAGLVAKSVMATLLLTSIWTWVLIIEGSSSISVQTLAL
jgi:biopolymer transport protein ExbB/TolQ